MKATDLYEQLELDFVRPGITEDWIDDPRYEGPIDAYICDNFRQRSMGLLCDFAQEVNKVYTAVFPNDSVLQKIIDDGASDAMLFLHHPLAWDLSRDPNIAFYQINVALLEQLKERRVALFNFHLPLDHFSRYSTGKTLADALGITVERPFAEYHGAMTGVIGATDCEDIHALNERYAQVVGHKTKLYQYGNSEIVGGRVGICAGGGNDIDVVNELIAQDLKVLITGLSVHNQYSAASHALEQKHKINLIGGTHYSSEKFACMAMCDYFTGLGLACEFIEDSPCFADL